PRPPLVGAPSVAHLLILPWLELWLCLRQRRDSRLKALLQRGFGACPEVLAEEGDGDAALGGEAGAVELVEQAGEAGEVAVDAAQQVVEHGVVELQAAAGGALAQQVAAAGFVQRRQVDARALAQAGLQV